MYSSHMKEPDPGAMQWVTEHCGRSLGQTSRAFLCPKWLSLSNCFGHHLPVALSETPSPGGDWLEGPDDGGIIIVCSGGGYRLDILSNLLLCLTWGVITRHHQQLLPSVNTSTLSSQPANRYSAHPVCLLVSERFLSHRTSTTSSDVRRSTCLTTPPPCSSKVGEFILGDHNSTVFISV
ncbi:hypothetical protein NHX12_027529 [Muraenolepis orangiensis]|uniref:Uncharacterized protein n=1 Tax=Muraenolepis orangiensis TaxID=630683 RepID=A0A9Q0EFN9_9TELE|nr:hypothetical protein NHX12_027529 [Muraenolepis orangiensis]